MKHIQFQLIQQEIMVFIQAQELQLKYTRGLQSLPMKQVRGFQLQTTGLELQQQFQILLLVQ